MTPPPSSSTLAEILGSIAFLTLAALGLFLAAFL
jgi:hypothetical protein